ADFLVQPEEAAALRSRVEMLRHDAMVRMLTERSILTEIQADRSDRVMLGAQKLLCKYVSCQFVWMEVCLKLASTAMVSVVGSKDGLWLSVAITLTMALVVGMAQPFVQPQVNALQTSCFT
ncbi:LRR receptor-like serine/threonine-protein kinase FLS2, partial [Durusdinium trenchii]